MTELAALSPQLISRFQPLVVLTGPTASGKTGLALTLATYFPLEIIAADSRTIYRGMDIATAKPTVAEQALVSHHLLDIIDPAEPFSLPDFIQRATTAITQVHHRQKLPLLVGGTLQYLNGLLQGWQTPAVAPDHDLRARLEARAAEIGADALFAELQAIDPVATANMRPQNIRRTVRALEVYYTTGQLFSQVQDKTPPPYTTLKLALDMPREQLYARADIRIANMLAGGLIEETQKLLAQGYSPKLPALSSVGYQQIISYLAGEISLEQAVEKIKTTTHRYIRQQYTWLRRDPAITWLDATSPDLPQQAQSQIAQFLASLQI